MSSQKNGEDVVMKQNAMNKYKGKVDNISFDVAKGARERYKRIAKEANLKLGEFAITAMEEYIKLHDLDTVDTYALRPSDSDELIFLEKHNCYFPISPETKEKLENGEIDGITVHEKNIQISGIKWSELSYTEKTSGEVDDSKSPSFAVSCPVPMINKDLDITVEETNRENDCPAYLLRWYSYLRNMFLVNPETKRVAYKLDHQPYKVIRNLENNDEPKDTPKATTECGKSELLDTSQDDRPITQKDLADTLPGLIEDAISKYLSQRK